MDIVSINHLHELFDVNFETGVLRWKTRPVSHFKDSKRNSAAAIASMWNARHAGAVAGSKHCGEYVQVRVGGVNCVAHRVLWAMAHGEWPAAEIDHLNGIRNDNRLNNLRQVTRQENQMNRKARAGTSRWPGVGWNKSAKKWQARIWINGRRKHLGVFIDEIDAAEAYRRAAIDAGFSDRHIQPFLLKGQDDD